MHRISRGYGCGRGRLAFADSDPASLGVSTRWLQSILTLSSGALRSHIVEISLGLISRKLGLCSSGCVLRLVNLRRLMVLSRVVVGDRGRPPKLLCHAPKNPGHRETTVPPYRGGTCHVTLIELPDDVSRRMSRQKVWTFNSLLLLDYSRDTECHEICHDTR